MSEEHIQTDQCGFDRNSSHSEGRYVCNCGWRDDDTFQKPDPELLKQAVRDVLFEMMEMSDMFPEVQEKLDNYIERAWNRAQTKQQQQRYMMTQLGIQQQQMNALQQQQMYQQLQKQQAMSPLGPTPPSTSSSSVGESTSTFEWKKIFGNLSRKP